MITIILILTILVAGLPFNKHVVSAQWLTRLSSIAIIFSSFLVMNTFYIDRLYDGLSVFSGFINISNLNQTFQMLLLLTGGFIVAAIVNFSSNSQQITNSQLAPTNIKYLQNYVLIILFNLIGASCLITSGDFLMLYIAVETQSFSLYILSALKNDSAKSASAGLKYFLIGSLASTLILLGISLFYYATGLTNFESIYVYYSITDWFSLDGFTAGLMEPESPYAHSIGVWNFAEINPYYSIGIFSFLLVIIGVLIKVGAAPFHQWSVDVYSLVPTAVTTWLVILPKIALFVLLFQLLQLVLETGNAMLYSSANNSIIEWMLDSAVQNKISDLTNSNTFNVAYVTDLLNNFYYDQLLVNLRNIYGDATHFYPSYLQIELLNTINSPIVSESTYNFVSVPESDGKDYISSIWSDYSANIHDSLYYTINITPIGAITIKNLLVLISVISLVIGAIGGLYQINIKRLLAFSAINQIGFLIIALAVNNKISLDSFIFYLAQYSITTLNVFFVLVVYGNIVYAYSYPLKATGIAKGINPSPAITGGSDIDYINQLRGFFEMNPILALSLIISLFSFIGVPPFPGFFAKQQVLLSALSTGWIFVSILAIVTSVVAASYYLNIIKSIILGKKNRTDLINKTPFSLGSFFNKSSNLQLQSGNKLSLSNISSYTISSLTLVILFYIFKFQFISNFISNITFCSFQL